MGKPSKRAARMRKSRLSESVKEKKIRLAKNRERNTEKRSNENCNERKSRLSEIRERAHRQLRRETSVQRAQRLNVIRTRLHTESTEKREQRLNVIRTRSRKEYKEKREQRLNVIRTRLRNESKDKREQRLNVIRTRLRNESKEQREHRLKLIRGRHLNQSNSERKRRIKLRRNRLQNKELSELRAIRAVSNRRRRENVETESTEKRMSRLKARSEKTKKQRKERILQEENFRSTINIFADMPCSVCYKTLYPQQRCTLHTSGISSIIPASLVESEVIITCSRCCNSLKKRKVPTQAFWNKMKVTDVPEEINNLTEIEKQMLCRIVPFMKIIKVNNRFSQKWFKGQVVLFARDVIEVAEQLPLNLNQTGVIFVTENLENINRNRQFQIDIGRLRIALEWLIRNNCLYKDVRAVYTNIISDITQITNVTGNIEETSCNRLLNAGEFLENESNVRRNKSEFVNLNENVSILRGSFHQGSDRFDIESRGKQCTAIATVACVAIHLLDHSTWCATDVDYVVLLGDKYYRNCMAVRRVPDPEEINADYLAVTELVPHLLYNNRRVNINVLSNVMINGHIDNDNAEEGFPNLRNGLETFFVNHEYGILTANSTSVAVSRRNTSNGLNYWLFDSHARGPKGNKAPLKGVSCCMKFSNVDDLFTILRRNLHCKTGNSNYLNVYSLTPLVLVTANDAVNMSEEQHLEVVNPEPLANEGEIIFSTSMLRAMDEGVPNIDSVVSVDNDSNNNNDVIDNNPIELANIKRKTAPPLNMDRERRVEELAWFYLFPDGKNGFGEERDISITPLDYFQARVMSNDRRFQRTDYLFFALSMVEYFRAKASVSVSCRMRQGESTPRGLVDNMHLTMRNIRGSSSYWRRCCSELIAMVRSLGPPTWFATFSCNDLNWSDMLKALLLADGRPGVEIETLPFVERLKLVEEYPVVVSRQFTVRVNALMQYLKNSDCLGGNVIDFWYRIEFQNRGSPHLHMLIWCANMPDFLSKNGQDVIEKVVSCSLDVPDVQLRNIVEKVQIHKHSSTCYKERNNSSCRFGFPRPISEKIICLGPDDTLVNNGRFCLLKRTSGEAMVNNYNPILLKLWEGNMDIQPCGNVTAVAYYIAKYASKCEPQDTGNAVKEAVSNAKRRGGTLWKQLFSVSMAILSQRLVSAAECAYRLCHLPLKMSSRKAIFINSCRPEQRYRILRFEGGETSIFNNIFDRYIQRPDDLEDLSLAEFAVRYETVSSTMWDEDEGDAELRISDDERPKFIKLKNNTRMRVRNKPAVLRQRYFTLNSDREGYFYNLIVCHIPFRNESELMMENESAEECFVRRQSELKPLLNNASVEQFAHAEQVIQAALAQAVALNIAHEDVEVENSSRNVPVIRADEEIYNCYSDVVEDQEQEIGAMPEDVFINGVRGLNVQQKDLFKKVSSLIEKNIRNESTEQMLLFITGGAGSGKSFILKLLVELIKRSYNPTVDAILKPMFVIVAALTGVAARQVFGKTLHSVFSLPIEKGSVMTYRKMTGQRLEQERRNWRYIKWLIIDEISMVSYENLRMIHLRLQEFKNNELLFGGINVLLLGDIMQLPPVKGHWCYMQPAWCAAEINLWHKFSFCELTINMRQKNDAEFIDLLNSLRFGELTTSQLEILCERRRIPLEGEFDDGAAVRIFPTLYLVDEYNSKMTETLMKSSSRMYTIDAVDESREAATYGKKPPENVIPSNANNCGGLLHSIILGQESRVMLRRNMSISDGLVNGAMGIVKDFVWPALRRDQLEEGELPMSVLIKFDDVSIGNRFKNSEGYVPIAPVTATFQATKGYGDVERRMLPLILSWAVTVHKLQGTTLDKAVIDLGKRNFAKGQMYVALSRVKNLSGIALTDLAANKILNKPHDERSFAEMQRLRNLSL